MNNTVMAMEDDHALVMNYSDYSFEVELELERAPQVFDIIVIAINVVSIISSLAVLVIHLISKKGRGQTGRCLLALLMICHLLRTVLLHLTHFQLSAVNITPIIMCEIVWILYDTLVPYQYILVLLLVVDNYLSCTRGEALAKKTADITVVVTFIAVTGATIGLIFLGGGFDYWEYYQQKMCYYHMSGFVGLFKSSTAIGVTIATVVLVIKTNRHQKRDDPQSAEGENSASDVAEEKTTGWSYWKQCVVATAIISACAAVFVLLVMMMMHVRYVIIVVWSMMLLLELLGSLVWLIPFILVKGGCLKGSSDNERALLMQ